MTSHDNMRAALTQIDNVQASPFADTLQSKLTTQTEASSKTTNTPNEACAQPAQPHSRRVSFQKLGGSETEIREEAASMPQLIEGEYTHMRNCKTSKGYVSVGLFHPKQGESKTCSSPRDKPKRHGCWVATSPAASPAVALSGAQGHDLTLWSKCEEPADEDAANWSPEEWAAWDLSQWRSYENEWDGKWESEYFWSEDEYDEEWSTPAQKTKSSDAGSLDTVYTGPFKDKFNNREEPYTGPFKDVLESTRIASEQVLPVPDPEFTPPKDASGILEANPTPVLQHAKPKAMPTPVVASTRSKTKNATPKAMPTPVVAAVATESAVEEAPAPMPTPLAMSPAPNLIPSTPKSGLCNSTPTATTEVQMMTPRGGTFIVRLASRKSKLKNKTPSAPPCTPIEPAQGDTAPVVPSGETVVKRLDDIQAGAHVSSEAAHTQVVTTPPHPEAEEVPQVMTPTHDERDTEFGSARKPPSATVSHIAAAISDGSAISAPVDTASNAVECPAVSREAAEAMKVVELRAELVKLGLPKNGLKAELIDRLVQASANVSHPPNAVVEKQPAKLEDAVVEQSEDLVVEEQPSALDVDVAVVEEQSEALDVNIVEEQPATLAIDDTSRAVDDAKLDSVQGVFEGMKVVELRELLESRGLKVLGKKAELIARLIEDGATPECAADKNQQSHADGTPARTRASRSRAAA
ncbi:hypothetical protein AB1Y20_001989 [Prymnesium parvum]|uniref:SAP domain-containing protein n=1 Tax=Prymnesium parvum TaxID=97485 RepID=A0AB34J9B2_PRYPA